MPEAQCLVSFQTAWRLLAYQICHSMHVLRDGVEGTCIFISLLLIFHFTSKDSDMPRVGAAVVDMKGVCAIRQPRATLGRGPSKSRISRLEL